MKKVWSVDPVGSKSLDGQALRSSLGAGSRLRLAYSVSAGGVGPENVYYCNNCLLYSTLYQSRFQFQVVSVYKVYMRRRRRDALAQFAIEPIANVVYVIYQHSGHLVSEVYVCIQ